jgi:NADPH-ferrihemoprotein reductase
MSSKEGKDEYKEKILDLYVGLVDLLQLCPSIRMPLEHFIAFCPPLQTRYFTISSSSTVHPTTVHLTVSVDQAFRKDGTVFEGVCSNYLARFQPDLGQTVRVHNRPSTFRLPSDTSKPILMIGPGTGIAPMRALLQERSHQLRQGRDVGRNVLYFGCKKRAVDYIYEDELAALQRDGILHELHVAFSREKAEKVYVQHLLKTNAEATWSLMHEEGAHIYVCGGVKMGSDVAEVLREIASTQGGLSPDASKEYIAALMREGRYVQELWA